VWDPPDAQFDESVVRSLVALTEQEFSLHVGVYANS
jgi:hypothetical protein